MWSKASASVRISSGPAARRCAGRGRRRRLGRRDPAMRRSGSAKRAATTKPAASAPSRVERARDEERLRHAVLGALDRRERLAHADDAPPPAGSPTGTASTRTAPMSGELSRGEAGRRREQAPHLAVLPSLRSAGVRRASRSPVQPEQLRLVGDDAAAGDATMSSRPRGRTPGVAE